MFDYLVDETIKDNTTIVVAGYLLLLSFASLKPFSFIKSLDFLSTLSRQIKYK